MCIDHISDFLHVCLPVCMRTCFFFFFEIGSCVAPRIHYVDKTHLEFLSFLPLFFKCQDHKHVLDVLISWFQCLLMLEHSVSSRAVASGPAKMRKRVWHTGKPQSTQLSFPDFTWHATIFNVLFKNLELNDSVDRGQSQVYFFSIYELLQEIAINTTMGTVLINIPRRQIELSADFLWLKLK